jgi:hypothetical protein
VIPMNLIDFSSAPDTPIERLVWMGGLRQAVLAEIEAEFQRTYFEARLQGMMESALDLKLHPKKKAVAWTRHENEARGRVVARWGDGY